MHCRTNFFNKALVTSDYAAKAYSNSTLLLAFIKFKFFYRDTFTTLHKLISPLCRNLFAPIFLKNILRRVLILHINKPRLLLTGKRYSLTLFYILFKRVIEDLT